MNRRWWLAVEQWEDALLATHERVVSFSCPALLADDPVHGDIEQTVGRVRMRQAFRLPRALWKLVVVRQRAGRLATAAFWLDQTELEAAISAVGNARRARADERLTFRLPSAARHQVMPLYPGRCGWTRTLPSRGANTEA